MQPTGPRSLLEQGPPPGPQPQPGQQPLLEREPLLAVLDGCLAEAASGSGRMALLTGEAGIGKTALAQAFCARHHADTQAWWGACDALQTPSPLAPLHDIARECGGGLPALLASGRPRHELFAGFLDTLTSPPQPVIVVFEDLHWADQATLDLLVFLARRITGTHTVLVATLRDDGLASDHPVRTVLGSLAGLPQVRRLPVPSLSERATAQLTAGAGDRHRVDPARVYQATGGNPFFVTALLAAPPDTVPETVRDAVLARVATLSPAARPALEAVAVVPDRVDVTLVGAVTGGPAAAAIEEGERAGILQVTGRSVSFRHELARQAVAASIPAIRAAELHAAVLGRLSAQPDADPAQLAYHAEQAHDRDAVLVHAPAAAAAASRLGAHRQALAHYRLALGHAEALPPAQRADLLMGFAGECTATGQHQAGVEALGEASALRQQLGDVDGCAEAMARQANLLYMIAHTKETYERVAEAIALVADRVTDPSSAPSPGPAVAAVYAYAAYLYMLGHDHAQARETSATAVALAEQVGDSALLALALVAEGGSHWSTNPEQAEAALVRAVEAAHESGRAPTVTTAVGFLGASALDWRRYQTADRWLARVVNWCEQHDLDAARDYYRAAQAGAHFAQGRWPQAAAIVDELTAPDAGTYPPARTVARRIAGRLAVRRGDPDQTAPLTEAWEQTNPTGDVMRIWPVLAARAEAAWHAGRSDQIPVLIGDAFEQILSRSQPWAIGELGFWLWRAGALDDPPEGAAEPYRLHMCGEWAAAAAAWEEVGCPYEAAEARADSDDPGQLRAALATFHQLGARPAANRLVHRLRRLGITSLPRRPHRSTGANPAGLTNRELEVAVLLVAGMSNVDIATRLHISPRTAGHHVAAILAKLEVTSRHDAARAARELGITGG